MADAYSFVVNFIANMAQLDASIATLPTKMAKAQMLIQQGMGGAAGGASGVGAAIGRGGRQVNLLDSAMTKLNKTTKNTTSVSKNAGAEIKGLNAQWASYVKKSQMVGMVTKKQFDGLSSLKGAGKDAKRGFMYAFRGQDTLMSIMGKVSMWLAATGVIFGTIRAITELTSRSIELEKHFADLKRVLPSNELKAFENQVFGMAHAFGVATTDVIDATFEWGKTTKELTDVVYGQQAAILAVKVGELELADATRFLTALYHSMGLRGKELIGVIDELNALQNEYGANIKGTLEVLSRSGGIIKAYGGDLQQTMALAAAALKMTGEQPSKVATLFRRLPDYLEQNKDQLQLLGVEIQRGDASYYSLEHQITSLMEAYTNADEEGKKAILRLSAEGRSRGILTTLLKNQDVYMAMLNETQNASGSAAIEYSQIMDTTAERMARLNATIDRFANASNVTSPVGEMISSFDAMLRTVLDLNEGVDDLISNLDDLPGKFPSGTTGGGSPETVGIGGVVDTIWAEIKASITDIWAGPGRRATIADIEDLMEDELDFAESAKERQMIKEKYLDAIRRTSRGQEISPDIKARLVMKELADNRDEVVRQTEESIRLEIQSKMAYMEVQEDVKKQWEDKYGKDLDEVALREKVIEEVGKSIGASKKTIETMKESARVRAKLADGLTEEQSLLEEKEMLNLKDATADYGVGILSAEKYQQELNRILAVLPEGTEGWINALNVSNKYLDSLEKTQQKLAGAAAELKAGGAGEGSVEKALREQQDATDTYNRIRLAEGSTQQEIDEARAASYLAGAKAEKAKLAGLKSQQSLIVAYSTSALQTAELEYQFAQDALDGMTGTKERTDQKAIIEQKRRSKVDATYAQQVLLLSVQESSARTEIEAIRISFAKAKLMKETADTFEEEQAAVIAMNETVIRQEEYNLNLMKARAQLEIATIRDPLQRVAAQIAHAQEMLALEQDELKQLRILAELENLRVSEIRESHDVEKATSEASIARMLEPLDQAAHELLIASQEIPWIRNMDGEAAAIRAQTALYEKAKQQQWDYYNQEKSINEMKVELGEMTVAQQAEALAKLAEGVEMTREQTYQLRTEMLRLQEESEAEKREAFNLPSITLPTIYEIKRSLQGGYQEGGYGDTGTNLPDMGVIGGGDYIDNKQVQIFVSENVDLAQLDAILARNTGKTIANETKNVGLEGRRY